MTQQISGHADIGVLIGRFQPFHNGHVSLLDEVLDTCTQLVIVVGSAYAARSLRNPWTLDERAAMIHAALAPEQRERVQIVGIPDVFYDDAGWVRRVREAVQGVSPAGATVRLYGHNKDASSYYLALFPGWDYAELPNFRGLSATPIREALLAATPAQAEHLLTQTFAPELSRGVRQWLLQFSQTPAFDQITQEAAAVQRFQQAWEGSPYPPIFVTLDALVQWRDQILLIRRGQRPGLGRLALPGGFLDPDERLEAGCRRELREETGLALPADLAPVRHFIADHPDRSDRGRFVTHVFHYRWPDSATPPPVAGGDDAASAAWHALATLPREDMFEDHYLILEHLLLRD